MTPSVQNNPARSRFELTLDGETAVAEYRLHGEVLAMTHTEVPRALQGRGVAGQLVQAALDHASRHKLRVDPQCPYVRSYMDKHPETHALRA